MKKKIYLLGVSFALFFSLKLLSQPADLFISEYVEGSGFNKAIEIYNGTSLPVDLGSGQYVVEVYFNGNITSSSVSLTGTITPGNVFILAHPSATLGITPNLTSSAMNYNGNDAIVLKKSGVSGTILDVIGQVGFNPGTQWGSNDTCTLDRTIRRKVFICQGDINPSNTFHTAPEWDGFPQNTFIGLGTHSTSCGSSGPGLTVSPSLLSFTSTPNVSSLPQTYVVSGNSLTTPVAITAPLNFQLALNGSGPYGPSLSVSASSFISGPVTIYVRYLPVSVGTQSGTVSNNSGTYTATLNVLGNAINLTPIPQIQGTSATSPFNGQLIATEGVVTAVAQGTNGLGGFFIQNLVSDNNPLTSEGVFVLNTSCQVNVGDLVTVSGITEEYFGRTQIKSVSSFSLQSTGNVISATTLTLPVTTISDFEKTESMLVTFTQSLTVTEVYDLARYGEVLLSANGRLITPTNFVDPNDQPAIGTTSSGTSNIAAVTTQQDLNDRSQILLDDKSNLQNQTIVPYVDAQFNTLRCGSTTTSLTGVLDFAFGIYRIQPVGTPIFAYAPRPTVPLVGNYNVKAGSFNVLNYFNGNGSGGGFPTSRGANTLSEFNRQRAKIIEAIKMINADVLGLMEMENDGDSALSAIADLVSGLNTAMGAGTYTYVTDPTIANGGTGSDEIKVALIYKPFVLTRSGPSIGDNNLINNRPPLAQTFIHNTTQEKFSIIVNHMKSKGCTSATGNDLDLGDGQSCYNERRKQQAIELLNFVNTIKTVANDSDIIAIGDFNAYEQEDPNDILLAGGLRHLLDDTYSYVFMGQSGSLDQAYVTPSLLGQVSGAGKWHINADEPVAKDYNQEFNAPYMYAADPYRSSDHDPIVVGLNLGAVIAGVNYLDESTLAVIKLIPNPSSGQTVQVLISSQVTGKSLVQIHDQLGRIILEQVNTVNNGENIFSLHLPEMSSGLYYVSVNIQGTRSTQKLLINKE